MLGFNTLVPGHTGSQRRGDRFTRLSRRVRIAVGMLLGPIVLVGLGAVRNVGADPGSIGPMSLFPAAAAQTASPGNSPGLNGSEPDNPAPDNSAPDNSAPRDSASPSRLSPQIQVTTTPPIAAIIANGEAVQFRGQ
ncbi:MAG: hypothetical protein ACO4AJ_15075, partial [Prochlorothrix sp.]